MSENTSHPASVFLQALVTIPISLLTTMVAAKCVTPMWTWFVTPTFGVAVPSFWMLVGLMMTVNFFTFHIKAADLEEREGSVLGLAVKIFFIKSFASLIALGVAYLVHTF